MKKRAGYKLIALLLCFVAAVCFITAALTVGAIRYAYPVKYEAWVEKYAAQYGVPKTLLLAVIKTESSFDPEAESSAGALGLTQITPETFHWLQTKTMQMEDELRRFLTQPRPAEEVLALAKQLGISERTLKIAKRNLGILSERRADQWLWRLPEQEGKGVMP